MQAIRFEWMDCFWRTEKGGNLINFPFRLIVFIVSASKEELYAVNERKIQWLLYLTML